MIHPKCLVLCDLISYKAIISTELNAFHQWTHVYTTITERLELHLFIYFLLSANVINVLILNRCRMILPSLGQGVLWSMIVEVSQLRYASVWPGNLEYGLIGMSVITTLTFHKIVKWLGFFSHQHTVYHNMIHSIYSFAIKVKYGVFRSSAVTVKSLDTKFLAWRSYIVCSHNHCKSPLTKILV